MYAFRMMCMQSCIYWSCMMRLNSIFILECIHDVLCVLGVWHVWCTSSIPECWYFLVSVCIHVIYMQSCHVHASICMQSYGTYSINWMQSYVCNRVIYMKSCSMYAIMSYACKHVYAVMWYVCNHLVCMQWYGIHAIICMQSCHIYATIWYVCDHDDDDNDVDDNVYITVMVCACL